MASTSRQARVARPIQPKLFFGPQLLHKICTDRAQVFHRIPKRRPGAARKCRQYNDVIGDRMLSARILAGVLMCLATAGAGIAAPAGEEVGTDVPLFRIYLADGSSVVSYGEYVRVDEEVVFSTPLGSSRGDPRLQVITLPAALVDWTRTERYSRSLRYQQYAAVHGEADFARMSADISAMLNRMAVEADPARAREIADQARAKLVEWPATHFGYRQHDISSIVALIDDLVANLAGSPEDGSAALTLVAMTPAVDLEPVLGMMSPRDQVTRLVTLVSQLPRSADRLALLRAALTILDDPASEITASDTAAVRRSLQAQIQGELITDERYAGLVRRLTDEARRAAAGARVTSVERVLASIDAEDAKLGRKRPELVQALISEIDSQLEAARDLRLRRDQWELRRHVYRSYVDTISVQVAQLVKAESQLDAIRRQAGPSPGRLLSLQDALKGGAERLERVVAPEQLRQAHELFVTAWRMAQGAVDTRHSAVVSGDVAVARQASSAAAGSLMLLSRAQAELRSALEMPKLK